MKNTQPTVVCEAGFEAESHDKHTRLGADEVEDDDDSENDQIGPGKGRESACVFMTG